MKFKKFLAFLIVFVIMLENFATIVFAVEENLTEENKTEIAETQDEQEKENEKKGGETEEKVDEHDKKTEEKTEQKINGNEQITDTQNKQEDINMQDSKSNIENNQENILNTDKEKTKINFEDANFESYIQNKYDFDKDGVITDSDMLQIEQLDLYNIDSNIKSFKGIESAKNAKSISITYYYNDADFSAFFEMTNIEHLSIYGTKYSISGIEKMTNLKSLTLYESSSDLDISYDSIKNLDLENLSISKPNSNMIFDLNVIANMKTLNYLRIDGHIANQQVLNNLQQITSLSLTNANIVDLKFLSNMQNIQSLDLSKNKITNISELTKLKNLNNVNLQNNPINIKSDENAAAYEELTKNGVYINVSEYDDSEILKIPDGEFKKCLLNNRVDINNDDEISKQELEKLQYLNIDSNYSIKSLEGLQYATGLKTLSLGFSNSNALNVSLEPIYNLTNLESITMYNGLSEENSFEFLKNLTNLKELELYNINNEIDLTDLGKYTNITSLAIHANSKLKNAEAIEKLSNLKKLDIYVNTSMEFDLGIVNNLKQLEELDISGSIENPSSLWNNSQLKRLNISYYNTDYNIDMNGIQNLQNLEYLCISGNICTISNLEQISKLEKLNELIIGYNTYSYNNKNNTNNTEREEKIVNILENLKCEKIILNYNGGTINLQGIECGTTKVIKFEDLSPIYKAYLNKDSKLYCKDLTISNNSYNTNNNIKVDNKNKTITIIAGNEVKDENASINLVLKRDYSSTYSTSVSLSWKDYKVADSQKEINIPDQNLKKVLLENHDIDSDGKITETDMINILNISAWDKKIKSIEGLQYAINLNTIELGNNEITDITPILNLEKLQCVIFYNNFISDITCLKNAKFLQNIQYDEDMNFEQNLIDFTQNNENYKILKEILYKNIKEGKESLVFVYTINSQKYGKINEIDNVVNLEANLKKKLIEVGIDTNKDGNITRRELYTSFCNMEDTLDLSNANITDILGLEYLNVNSINLSNNKITDITPLSKNNTIYDINLSNNNISKISGIENCKQLRNINLSNNTITDITPISKLFSMTENGESYDWEYGEGYTEIDLSHNEISNIDCIGNWKNIGKLNLSYNKISNISVLKDYVFPENVFEGQKYIDLSNNYINLNNKNNAEAQEHFKKNKNPLILDNQKSLSDIEGFEVSQKYNSNTNTVTVTITSKSELQSTKPTWVLSKDKLQYSKEYDNNGDFSTTIVDINGYSETVSFSIKDIDKKGPEIKIEKKYDKETNTVTVFARSNEILGQTKSSWTLSDDKLTYSKVYELNGEYSTSFSDIYGNVSNVSFYVNEIESEFKVSQEYNAETNKVLVKVQSKCAFKETKPSWTLSKDKLTYSKMYEENGTYSTTFSDINGNVENIIFTIEKIDQDGPEIKVETKYNEKTNTVTVFARSNEILGKTKPTWNLSDDKLTYSKTYEDNGTYTTTISDIYGNTTKISFDVTEIQSGYEVFQSYNKENNKVTVEVKSKCKLLNTKPSWKLSKDNYTYSKEYNANGTYTTPFTDINNKTENVTFAIKSIDDKAPEIKIEKVYNEEKNTVTVKAISNEILGQTKPSWNLSDDKLTYSKEYNTNADFNTTFADVYGNTVKVLFKVEEIQSGFEVSQSYDSKLNIVTVNVKSKCKLQNTKPTWTLSEDGYTYSKVYRNNGTYKITFTDVNGKSEDVTFEVTLIDEEGPKIKIEKNYDKVTNTVIVKAISNEILGQTKPSWNLSEDRLVYSKKYSLNGTYSTVFRDQYGNMINVTFDVEEVQSGFEVTQLYDSKTNKVTITVKSICELQNTKPTWNLSDDKLTYSKTYEENGTYTTAFTDINGNTENIKFNVTEIDNEGPEIKIKTKYDEKTNTVTVYAISNEILGQTKPTWNLSDDKLTYSKEYEINGTYTTTFSDAYGNTSKVTFKIENIKN